MLLKKLADVTGHSYRKVVRILEIFAKVRICVVLLDLENESLVIEMFKILLETIRYFIKILFPMDIIIILSFFNAM